MSRELYPASMSTASLAEAMRTRLLRDLPGVAAWYARFCDSSIGEVTSRRRDYSEGAARRLPSAALVRVMVEKTRSLLGDAAAEAMRLRLSRDSAVLAAHHHGINSHPEFVQSAYFFGLPDILAADAGERIVPVLACSSVSLRSYSFPRGLLLGRGDAHTPWVRLPLFPASMSDLLAGTARGLTPEHCRNARQQWLKLSLASWERDVAMRVLEEAVQQDEIFALSRFSDQATRINARLWRSFPGGPFLAFLDLEDIATELLMEELAAEDSLFSLLLCDPVVRGQLLENLTGVSGCWSPGQARVDADGEVRGGGTVFFWMVDAKGRRFPLFPDVLQPSLLRCGEHTFVLQREALMEGLTKKTLRPGLFCSYVLLSLVHGLSLYGGMYMTDYLPAMERGVRDALWQTGQSERLPAEISTTCGIGSVFMPISRRVDGERSPAGLLEILACVDECRAALPALQGLQVSSVFPLSVAAWYTECFSSAEREVDWRDGLHHLREQSSGLELPVPDYCTQKEKV